MLNSKFWAAYGLELEATSDTSSLDDVSSSDTSSTDSVSSVPVGDSGGSSDISVGNSEVSSVPVLVIGQSAYDDTQLITGMSDINGRLERINLAIDDSNRMFLMFLVILVGAFLSYLFYSIVKKFM